MRDYQQAAIELGFLHHRYLRGTAPEDYAVRGQDFLARINAIRPGIAFPGQVVPDTMTTVPDPTNPFSVAHGGGAPTAGSYGTVMLTALVRLHHALQEVRLPLELPGIEEQRTGLREMVDQLEDYVIPRVTTLEAPLLAVVGGSTGRRQVDAGQLAGRPQGHPARAAPPDHPLAGAGAPPRRRVVVRRRPAAARPRAGRPPDHRPGGAPAGRRRRGAARAGHPRRARRRLGGRGEPRARRPAARRRRPVAVRHLGRAVRRPGPVGVPPPGRRALHLRRDRPRPHAARRPCRPSPPTWPGCWPAAGSRTRRCSSSTRDRSATRSCCPPTTSPRSAAGWSRWPATPGPASRWSSRPSTAPSAP